MRKLFFILWALTPLAQVGAVPIGAVQGTGEKTPLDGQIVTIRGTVTGDFQAEDQLGGFFVQDGGDGTEKTSDGIFVYAPLRRTGAVDVNTGDVVSVTGRAEEFSGQTQIGAVQKAIIETRAALPAPVVLNWPLPAQQNAENFENMLVTLPQTLTVTSNYELGSFGSLMLSAGGRLLVSGNFPENRRAAVPPTLLLDDGSAKRNPKTVPYLDANGTRRAGDRISGLTGVFTFGWGAYRLHPTTTPRFENANPRPAAPPAVGGSIRVMSFNLHNYFTTMRGKNNEARGASSEAEFARQSAKLVAAVLAVNPDVLACIEVENNGEKAARDFMAKLNAAGGDYAVAPDPQGGLGTDVIRVALLYKPAKLALRGTSQSDASRIFDRPPLAQAFATPAGSVFTVVVNHFKSKGSCPETGDVDKGEGCWNERRTAQSAQLLKFVAQLQKQNGADVLVLGDLNAHSNEAPLRALREGGLAHVGGAAPERYSFVFGGHAGALDHALVTPSLSPKIANMAEWHINADEPLLFEKTPDYWRSSDHDPLILGLKLP